MKIYNSLTRKKEEFAPPNNEVRMYVCGITAYDVCHLGHLRSAIVFDVIRSYFHYKGYKVKFVKNITDVDDKIIDKARKLVADGTYKDLKEAAKAITEKYIKEYYEDMAKFNIEKAHIEPRATEHIPDMINLIKRLIEKGNAYVSGSDVYFDVPSFDGYGELSNQDLENLKQGARIEPGEKKKSALDFALWKSAKEDEPSWDSPWGKGRPGWHIECSVMSSKYLGEGFDIHGGGIDLIFPHHENERAQSEAAFGKFAKIWMHNGLLTVNGEKMAKSLGNYITIEDALKKYDAETIRLFMLSSHYRSPVDFTEEKMQEVRTARERFYELIDKIERYTFQPYRENAFTNEIDRLKDKFIEFMDDDFNTPAAKGVLFDIVHYTNNYMRQLEVLLNNLYYSKNVIIELSKIFGLTFKKEEVESVLKAYVELKIEERDKARKKKDFKKADEIREELQKNRIVIKDTKKGTIWRKI